MWFECEQQFVGGGNFSRKISNNIFQPIHILWGNVVMRCIGWKMLLLIFLEKFPDINLFTEILDEIGLPRNAPPQTNCCSHSNHIPFQLINQPAEMTNHLSANWNGRQFSR